jgi:hypothetical protein
MTMRKAAVAAAALILLAALGWGAGFLYWHLRIRWALRTLEQTDHRTSVSDDDRKRQSRAVETLESAGCRALPYLLDALDESKDPTHLSTLTVMIAWESVFPGKPAENTNSTLALRRMEEWTVECEDSPEARMGKLQQIRAWWKAHASEHHQVWRIWTGECRPYSAERDENPSSRDQ